MADGSPPQRRHRTEPPGRPGLPEPWPSPSRSRSSRACSHPPASPGAPHRGTPLPCFARASEGKLAAMLPRNSLSRARPTFLTLPLAKLAGAPRFAKRPSPASRARGGWPRCCRATPSPVRRRRTWERVGVRAFSWTLADSGSSCCWSVQLRLDPPPRAGSCCFLEIPAPVTPRTCSDLFRGLRKAWMAVTSIDKHGHDVQDTMAPSTPECRLWSFLVDVHASSRLVMTLL